jgi:hypothetical protein
MTALRDPNVWLAVAVVLAILVSFTAVLLVLRHVTLKLLRWLVDEIVAVMPAPYGRWIVAVARFYYVATLFGGLVAFGVSLAIWQVPSFPGFDDPTLKNPLFWLTCLAIMTAIMLVGIAGGVLARAAVEFVMARLRQKLAGKRR